MKPAEKDAVMERFSRGEIDILVSTTVVEVGVDVPNATLIVIENAESYGLAQLHQLRGRVGRGASAAYCYLLTSGDTKPSRRLMELSRSNDGFHLAEVDLKLRGPGEIYGALQHGALDLRIASLSDTKLIARAQRDVEAFLREPENMVKYKELMAGIAKYQQITTLN
jgi:ATP-dependent DNA helicase RecG